MKITTVSAKKIRLFTEGEIYVLAVSDANSFYDFWLMHEKMESALKMFGCTRVQALDDETLLYIAIEGWNAYREEYLAMLEDEYAAERE